MTAIKTIRMLFDFESQNFAIFEARFIIGYGSAKALLKSKKVLISIQLTKGLMLKNS